MKAIHTVLCILTLCLIGCSPAKKENPKGTNQDNFEAALNGPAPEIPVDVSTHIRIENQTRSTIAIKVGSIAEKIEPGTIVFIPEDYENENRLVAVRIAQEKEGEWKMVYASKWHLSEKRIESYVVNETTSGKFTIFGIRDPIGGSDENEEHSLDVVPRRRVLIENKEPIQSERDNG